MASTLVPTSVTLATTPVAANQAVFSELATGLSMPLNYDDCKGGIYEWACNTWLNT